jgi:hypothetical protein
MAAQGPQPNIEMNANTSARWTRPDMTRTRQDPPRSQVFLALPRVQYPTVLFGECKALTATHRLVIDSLNHKAGIITKQKSADGTVADKQHIPCSISSQEVFDLPDNAQLGINRSLPTSNAHVRLRKSDDNDQQLL